MGQPCIPMNSSDINLVRWVICWLSIMQSLIKRIHHTTCKFQCSHIPAFSKEHAVLLVFTRMLLLGRLYKCTVENAKFRVEKRTQKHYQRTLRSLKSVKRRRYSHAINKERHYVGFKMPTEARMR